MRKLFLLALFLLTLKGCGMLGYYSQSIAGHTRLMAAREPIDKVLKTADEDLKQRLVTAQEIRQFAVTHLFLPDNKSYTSYVQLKSDPPIWNVVAADEFSLAAKQWCYLVIGCASYRGYYHREAADKYADRLKREGYDVAVVGAAAYSTLGWFADPRTSAMFKWDDASLADLMFHELAHQQLYIKDNSRFNEAFATAVGEQGALHWLQTTGRDELLVAYQTRLSVKDDFLQIINDAKLKLNRLYATDLAANLKRQQKQEIFTELRAAHKRLQIEKWHNKGWYNRWFSQPINNARLAAIATYRDLVPDFLVLLEQCDRDFPRFYNQVKTIGESDSLNLDVGCE